jgi:hypothetical protein
MRPLIAAAPTAMLAAVQFMAMRSTAVVASDPA